MKYTCVIFDCDGVLVDSEPIANRVLVKMAHTVGLQLDLDYVHKNYEGKSLKSCFDDIEIKLGKKLPNDFEQKYRKKTFDAFSTDLEPIKGIHNLLDSLTVPYAVASNGPLNKMELNLTKAGLIDKFRGNMFSAYEVGSWKPNPKIYLHAAEKMGFEVGDCAVVEDSKSGILAAIAGGFDVYRYTNGLNDIPSEGAIVSFQSMDDLLEILSVD